MKNKTMLIELEGEQTAYPKSELTQSYIQLNLKVILDSLALAQDDKIMMAYTNENATQHENEINGVGVVEHNGLRREPDRNAGIDGLGALEGAGDDPVQGEGEQERQNDQQDDADDLIRRNLMHAVILITGLRLLEMMHLRSGSFDVFTHFASPPLLAVIALGELELQSAESGDDQSQNDIDYYLSHMYLSAGHPKT